MGFGLFGAILFLLLNFNFIFAFPTENGIKNDSQQIVSLEKESTTAAEDPCEFSLRKIPGLKVVNIDRNGKKCEGEIEVPFCRGLCKTTESGTHTFPYRNQESYFCGLVEEKNSKNVTLEECDEGVEEYARFVEISSATECQCQKMP